MTVGEAYPNHVLVPCEWADEHVFVHPESPGWKRHPFTQYAATLYELARMCHKCGALIREGEGTDGKVRWYTAADSREHWRECLPVPVPTAMTKMARRGRTGGRR